MKGPASRGLLRLSAAGVLLVGWTCGSSACAVRSPDEIDREVAAQIEEGRALLRKGRPDDALRLFERAGHRSPSLETRMWVLRAWMDQGRSNDALDGIDSLRRSGHEGIELDYLYGMAFARRARDLVSSGVGDSSVQMNFIDATAHLKRVVDTAAERFPDAYLWLARSAWSIREYELARSAAEGAVRAFPRDGVAWLSLGRVAMSQFTAIHRPPFDPFAQPSDEAPSETWSTEAESHRLAGEEAFRTALDALAIPKDESGRTTLARAGLELGHALMWKKRFEEAADAYAISIAFDPDGTDYAQLLNVFQSPPQEGGEMARYGPHPAFLRALEAGTLAFHARAGLEDERDGTLLWWLGWARFEAERTRSAERAFLQSLEKLPEAANAWHYVGLCRYAEGDYPGACKALRRGWEIDPPSIVKEMQRDLELNLAKLDWMIDRTPRERLLDRAVLSEICAETARDEVRYWNNMGLFLRDAAERMREDPAQHEHFTELCEQAFTAYRRALDLSPKDPQVLNDTAVMLHYYLERDYELAHSMYERSAQRARERLGAEDLSADDRRRFETAHTDARTNLDLLRLKMR